MIPQAEGPRREVPGEHQIGRAALPGGVGHSLRNPEHLRRRS
jgi:hypothetical protein